MKFAVCMHKGAIRSGAVKGNSIALHPVASTDFPLLTDEMIANATSGETVPLTDVQLLSPIGPGAKILCVGFNYPDHVLEAKAEMPKYPSIFVRFASSLAGHEQSVVAPANSAQFDYEGEFAVVIGKPAWRTSREDAMKHVAGYVCLAENSARDFQFHTRQATAGKNFPHSGACGPWITSADEIPDVKKLEMTVTLNEARVQHCSIGDLIFDIPALIEYISNFTPLVTGDVISTGTPAGVGGAQKPPLWLKAGDRLEINVPGVGLLANTIVDEKDALDFLPF
jgi:2-keto-4-pentenoate hydratase/2-oxohepta-3-ene-1,7-dioic acid hydratase in catechol pathway